MEYMSVKEWAEIRGVSEMTARNSLYCPLVVLASQLLIALES